MKERGAKEAKFLEMFKHLRKHLGKEVTCIYWNHGNREEETAYLVELSDFDYVQIGINNIPFVGNGIAIIEIVSTEGKALYSNPYIEYEYNRTEEKEVDDVKKLVFGNRIVEIKKENTK